MKLTELTEKLKKVSINEKEYQETVQEIADYLGVSEILNNEAGVFDVTKAVSILLVKLVSMKEEQSSIFLHLEATENEEGSEDLKAIKSLIEVLIEVLSSKKEVGSSTGVSSSGKRTGVLSADEIKIFIGTEGSWFANSENEISEFVNSESENESESEEEGSVSSVDESSEDDKFEVNPNDSQSLVVRAGGAAQGNNAPSSSLPQDYTLGTGGFMANSNASSAFFNQPYNSIPRSILRSALSQQPPSQNSALVKTQRPPASQSNSSSFASSASNSNQNNVMNFESINNLLGQYFDIKYNADEAQKLKDNFAKLFVDLQNKNEDEATKTNIAEIANFLAQEEDPLFDFFKLVVEKITSKNGADFAEIAKGLNRFLIDARKIEALKLDLEKTKMTTADLRASFKRKRDELKASENNALVLGDWLKQAQAALEEAEKEVDDKNEELKKAAISYERLEERLQAKEDENLDWEKEYANLAINNNQFRFEKEEAIKQKTAAEAAKALAEQRARNSGSQRILAAASLLEAKQETDVERRKVDAQKARADVESQQKQQALRKLWVETAAFNGEKRNLQRQIDQTNADVVRIDAEKRKAEADLLLSQKQLADQVNQTNLSQAQIATLNQQHQKEQQALKNKINDLDQQKQLLAREQKVLIVQQNSVEKTFEKQQEKTLAAVFDYEKAAQILFKPKNSQEQQEEIDFYRNRRFKIYQERNLESVVKNLKNASDAEILTEIKKNRLRTISSTLSRLAEKFIDKNLNPEKLSPSEISVLIAVTNSEKFSNWRQENSDVKISDAFVGKLKTESIEDEIRSEAFKRLQEVVASYGPAFKPEFLQQFTTKKFSNLFDNQEFALRRNKPATQVSEAKASEMFATKFRQQTKKYSAEEIAQNSLLKLPFDYEKAANLLFGAKTAEEQKTIISFYREKRHKVYEGKFANLSQASDEKILEEIQSDNVRVVTNSLKSLVEKFSNPLFGVHGLNAGDLSIVMALAAGEEFQDWRQKNATENIHDKFLSSKPNSKEFAMMSNAFKTMRDTLFDFGLVRESKAGLNNILQSLNVGQRKTPNSSVTISQSKAQKMLLDGFQSSKRVH